MSGFIYPPESVYNLLPKEEVQAEKPPRYMSKFRPKVIMENKSAKDVMRTMGPAKVEVLSPDKYLKKHTRETQEVERSQCFKGLHTLCTARKPPVPRRTEQPVMGLQTERNFVKTVHINATTKPQPYLVDSKKGHKQHIEDAGLIPKYIKKKDYGEVPEYLLQRKEQEKEAQEMYENAMKEERERRAIKRLPDEERQKLLKGLKTNWGLLLQEYQGLPLIIDTMSKKAHKERLEKQMRQLELDISTLERPEIIYIVPD